MRMNAVFKYQFPFEYWVLTATTSGDTGFAKTSDMNGMLLPGVGGNLYLITEEQMRIGMQVRNLRDRSGAVVTQAGGEPYPMYVYSADPQLDPFGKVVSWKHTLKREIPKDLKALMDSFLADIGE